jgi:hypothetical protein
MGRGACLVLAMALGVTVPKGATAQGSEWDQEGEGEAETESDSETDSESESDSETDSEAEAESDSETDSEAEAEPEAEADAAAAGGARKFYFGLYARYTFIPSFWLGVFLDEAPTVANFAPGGVAVNIWNGDDGGPSFQLGIGYTSYAFEDPFRVADDPREDTEWVKSTLGMVHLTASVLWNTEIVKDKLHFEYGLGLDLGIVTGKLVRSEARLDASGNWVPCTSKNDPADLAHQYCELPTPPTLETNADDQDGAHYNVEDGSIPPVFPMPLLPHLALRYEPIEGLALKFEAILFPAVSFGLSAAYAPF